MDRSACGEGGGSRAVPRRLDVNRVESVDLLTELPALEVVAHYDVLQFVRRHGLSESGIGWIDAHLLCAAAVADLPIWTHDRNLRARAAKLGLLAR